MMNESRNNSGDGRGVAPPPLFLPIHWRGRWEDMWACRPGPESPYRLAYKNGDVADNGGRVKHPVVYTILHYIINIQEGTEPLFDLGSGDGTVPMAARAYSRDMRPTYGIEIAKDRVEWCQGWRDNVLALWGDHPDVEPFLPRFVEANFTDKNVPYLDDAIATCRPIIFLNNAEGRMSSNHTQAELEWKLEDCREGTVVVTLDRSFQSYDRWHEEAFVMTIRKEHLSWTSGSPGTKEFTIYKYTRQSTPRVDYQRVDYPRKRIPFPLGAWGRNN